MFVNKAPDGSNNLCGRQVARLRSAAGLSQRELADLMQLRGLTIDKNAIQRMESGQRFVTDVELPHLAAVLNVTVEALLAP